MALWAPGPGHVGRSRSGVIGRGCGDGRPAAKSDTSTTAKPPSSSAKYARLPSLLIDSEWRAPVEYPCSPLNSVTGASPRTTGEMSQTENGHEGEPPLIWHVEPALPAKMSARSGFHGSCQRKNSCVSALNWWSSRGLLAFVPET